MLVDALRPGAFASRFVSLLVAGTALLILAASGLHAVPPTLSVVEGQGTMMDGATAAYFDFGTRTGADESPLVHVFILRNLTSAPLLIVRLQSSCGCTTAAAGTLNSLPLTVAPGQSVPIRVEISPRRLLPGSTHKSVWVYTHGAGDASTLLEMRGIVQDVTPSAIAPDSPLTAQNVPARSAGTSAEAGSPAPPLTGTDTRRQKFTLTAWRGHPAVLLFFCGCPWCTAAAHAWGHVQRAGTLPPGTRTLVVFDGDRAAAAAFASATALDPSRTTLLPDPNARLTEGVYKVSSCPRVFALDTTGIIQYTNSHQDDQPRQAAPTLLASRLQASLSHHSH